MPRTYRAEMASVAFTTLEAVKVVQTMAGDAVVIHKILLVRDPGAAGTLEGRRWPVP